MFELFLIINVRVTTTLLLLVGQSWFDFREKTVKIGLLLMSKWLCCFVLRATREENQASHK